MYKNILIPVMLDKIEAPHAVFQAAQALADEDCKFTILHVVEAVPAYFMAEFPTGLVEERREEIKASLVEIAKGLPGAKTKLISGHAGTTIVGYAEDNDVDCIVVQSHQPGFQDFFLGSTAARVVRHAKCSVHVIR